MSRGRCCWWLAPLPLPACLQYRHVTDTSPVSVEKGSRYAGCGFMFVNVCYCWCSSSYQPGDHFHWPICWLPWGADIPSAPPPNHTATPRVLGNVGFREQRIEFAHCNGLLGDLEASSGMNGNRPARRPTPTPLERPCFGPPFHPLCHSAGLKLAQVLDTATRAKSRTSIIRLATHFRAANGCIPPWLRPNRLGSGASLGILEMSGNAFPLRKTTFSTFSQLFSTFSTCSNCSPFLSTFSMFSTVPNFPQVF